MKWKCILLVAVAAMAGLAQSISSSLSGTVLDAQGLAVQNANVRVSNRTTNEERQLRTDGAGVFRASALPPGMYRVEITAPGFGRITYEEIALIVGQTQTLRPLLQPESTKQEITVAADGVTAVTYDAGGNGKNYGQMLMQDLPMATGGQGRNFRTQAYLTPAVAQSTAAHRPFSVAGARNRNVNYLIDSNDYNEIEGGMLMGRGVSEQLIASESIEGMQVLTHNFKAEYGRQNGAIVSLVSKRGGNEWHGTFYEYFRHDKLAARNAFDNDKPALHFNFFGASGGGALKKDKIFVFGNWEGFNRVVGAATTIQTLLPAQRAQAVEAVRPLAARFPEPNVAGTNLFRANAPQGGFMHTFLARMDVNATDRQRLFTRSTYLNSNNQNTSGAAQSNANVNTQPQGHSLHHVWTPRANVVNEARFNYTRYRLVDTLQEDIFLGDPAINGELGFLQVNGLTSLGFSSFLGRRTFQNNFQYTNDLTFVMGRHSLKTGVAARRMQLNNGVINAPFNGSLRFNNVNDFLSGRPASYTRNFGQPYVGLRATEFNTFFQDDWQVTPRLLLNLGARYEYNQSPREVNGLIADKYRLNGDGNNLAPRFGFAYRADRDGKSVIRGGYGIYYNVLELVFAGMARFNPPLITSQANAAPRFPNLLAGASSTIPSGLVYPDGNLRNPYSQHLTLTYERELFNPRTTISVGYIGTLGRKLPFVKRPNGGDGLAQTARPDPALGVVNVLSTGLNSHYQGLQSSLTWQRRGTMVRASYTWSKAIDTASDIPSTNQNLGREILPLDEGNWGLNRGPGDFDVRRMFNVAWSYELPWMAKNRMLGGWSLQGIVTANSGRPYTLYAGVDTHWGNNNNRIFDLTGTLVRNGGARRRALDLASGVTKPQLTPGRGAFGTIGRNTERGDSLSTGNVSVFKTFAIAERWRLQFRAESFNVTNTVNYAAPDGVLSSANFGQALAAEDSRQHQLVLRLSF
ncbi:MAG: TonB-dependent receptor domain-containing protein [Bryobacteraceae bacterium]